MVDVVAPKTTTMDEIHNSSIVSAVVDSTQLKLKNRAGTEVASLLVRNNPSTFSKAIVRLGGKRYGYKDTLIKRWYDRRRGNKLLPVGLGLGFNGRQVKFSPDGLNLMATVFSGNPKGQLQMRNDYALNVDPWTKAEQLSSSIPDGIVPRGYSYSPDSEYLAYGTSSDFDESVRDPHILVLKRDPNAGNDIDFTSSPGYGIHDIYTPIYPGIGADDQPQGKAIFMETAWHPDGYHLTGIANNQPDFDIIVHGDLDISASPWIFTYKRSGDSFSLLNSPSVVPVKPMSLSYSPDGKYLVVGCASTPGSLLVSYMCDGDELIPFDLVDQPPGSIGTVTAVRFSPDSQYLAVGTAQAPYFLIYKKVNGRFVLDVALSTSPGSQVNSLDWSPDARYVVLGTSAAPSFHVYGLKDDLTWFKLPDPDTMPTTNFVYSVSWCPDGLIIAVSTNDVGVKFIQSVFAPVPGAAIMAFDD